MRLFLLTALAMVAFAANSLLNRLALESAAAAPAGFAALRLASGALCLWLLVRLRGGQVPWVGGIMAPAALALYMLGFSFAYVTLPAGLGALILFGGVQITMFVGALAGGEVVSRQRWAGAGLAFAGLVWLLWPQGGADRPDLAGAALMAAAALGWGIYSLAGRGAVDPLAMTARNFLFALPAAVIALALAGGGMTPRGAMLAVISGAVTSGMGYALWYAVLPRLTASAAAVAQLTVPVIAMAGAMLLLSEPLTLRFVIAALLVLGGVALASAGSARADRKSTPRHPRPPGAGPRA